jgi:hypothetical protein
VEEIPQGLSQKPKNTRDVKILQVKSTTQMSIIITLYTLIGAKRKPVVKIEALRAILGNAHL